ncbi:IS6 family transposase [Carnobacterium maltaromaticum]|uniref:IS6 family transposase n=1 Tax=Carnobacterium maltaromaticum TaxID=2751 RepID=UPI000704AD5C|nr:IS6 family transposase [Carnobacterium maltaromaticum]MBC9809586.1 IS6 family transposase [Carnobacterium maltaromaticum]CRH18981.1 transposase [Carnobacterium maltaromaticum]CRH21716.1 transposase [Carnobacterium maltaromaticum]
MRNVFKGKQFDKRIIIEAVGLYCRFSLSYRDVSEILRHRGIQVNPTTIMRWVHQYGNLLFVIWKKKNKPTSTSWRMDETYIKIKRKQHYLYRAIDSHGNTLDMCLRKHRDTNAAYAFMKRLIRRYGEPRALVTDKCAATIAAVNKLKNEGFLKSVDYRLSKYLNNVIEQDHRQIKKRFSKSLGFQSMKSAATTIQGIEVVNALYKKSRRIMSLFDFSVWDEIRYLLEIA